MLNTGDRVGYARAFLKSTGADYDMAQRRGTIVEPTLNDTPPNLALIHWDDTPPGAVSRALAINIAKVGSVRFAD